MEEIRDYYAFLGVPHDASTDEIKRAWRRKLAEFQNDEEKTIQANQAYEVLLDLEKRQNYDNSYRYGKQLIELWEKYHAAESRKEVRELLIQLRTIYKKMESENNENLDILKKLFEIERELGDEKELPYLDSIMDVVLKNEKLENRIEWLRFLGENFERYENVDEAIKAYSQIYKIDATDDSVCDLIDLLYREKKNAKIAIQILNDCINRVEEKQLKARYLSKAYEVVCSMQNNNFEKLKSVLLAKLQAFKTEEEQIKTSIAAQIVVVMAQCLGNEQLVCYDELEKVLVSLNIENEAAKLLHKALQEYKLVIANKKYHECLELLSEEIWTEKLRRKMEVLMLNEMEEIKQSLDYYKKFAPTMWNLELEVNQKMEDLINRAYPRIVEYKKLVDNSAISNELKTIIKTIAFEGIIRFEKLEAQFAKSEEIFFADNHIAQSRQEIRLLERLYPACYQRFSEIFFDGQSTKELFGEEPRQLENTKVSGKNDNSPSTANRNVFYPNAQEGYEHKPYISGFFEFLFIVIGTCCFPPALPVILISKYYHRHQKKIVKVAKRVLTVAIILLLIAGIYLIGTYIREKQYEENHDNVLTDSELKKIEQLQVEYAKKAGINIMYIQSEESQVEVHGDYILLSYYINHPIWDSGYGVHTRGVLTQEQTDELGTEISAMLENEYLTDYEKCERFFEIAYNYVDENNILEQAAEEDNKDDANKNAPSLEESQNNQADSKTEVPDESVKETEVSNEWEIEMNMIYYEMATDCTLEEFITDIQVEPFDTYSYQSGGSKGLFNATFGGFTGELHYSDAEEIGFYLETDEPITESNVTEIFNAEPLTNITDNKQIFVWRDKVEMSVYYHSYCTAIYFELYSNNANPEGYIGSSEEENTSGELNVSLEEVYEMLTNDYTFEQIKSKYPTDILYESDNYLLECYGYVGAYKGCFSYCTGCPVYGIGDINSEYENFSWTSEFGTWCSNEYLCEEWGLTYVDSGYNACNGSPVTIYDWKNKLVITVLQAEGSHTLIQILPIANYRINYW